MRTTGPRGGLAFNPVYAVELEPEETPEGQRWSPAEAARFLAATAADPLGLMWPLAVFWLVRTEGMVSGLSTSRTGLS